jgi:hypothetical protein
MADPSSRPRRNPDGSYSEDFVQQLLKMIESKNEQLSNVTKRLLQLEIMNNKNVAKGSATNGTDTESSGISPYTDTTST